MLKLVDFVIPDQTALLSEPRESCPSMQRLRNCPVLSLALISPLRAWMVGS